jgi:hypothetical protein
MTLSDIFLPLPDHLIPSRLYQRVISKDLAEELSHGKRLGDQKVGKE